MAGTRLPLNRLTFSQRHPRQRFTVQRCCVPLVIDPVALVTSARGEGRLTSAVARQILEPGSVTIAFQSIAELTCVLLSEMPM